jgi:hypothetical protein
LQEVGLKEGRKKFTTKVLRDGTFTFNLVKAGKWDVQIEQNNFCYKEATKRVKLDSRKRSDLEVQFEMIGRQLKYESSNSFEAVARRNDGAELEIAIKKGKHNFCASEGGFWSLKPKNDCLKLAGEVTID